MLYSSCCKVNKESDVIKVGRDGVKYVKEVRKCGSEEVMVVTKVPRPYQGASAAARSATTDRCNLGSLATFSASFAPKYDILCMV